LKEFQDGRYPPYTVSLNGDNANEWIVTFPGPEGSTMAGVVNKLKFVFDYYPFKVPKVYFITKFTHPFVDDSDSRIHIPILEEFKWTQQTHVAVFLEHINQLSVANILEQINQLLFEPSVESPELQISQLGRIPNFIPNPAEQLKSILIVGAHPDEIRWKQFWQTLADNYDLTFIFSPWSNDRIQEPTFKLSDGSISPLKNDQVFGNVGFTEHVEVWKTDFNETNFEERIIRSGKKFDLIINDYSVFKFMFMGNPLNPVTALLNSLKPNGYCVLGAFNEVSNCDNCFSVLGDFKHFETRIASQFQWHIGKTKADMNKIIEKVISQTINPRVKFDSIGRIVKMAKDISVENATNLINMRLSHVSTRGWNEINPIQVVKLEEIQEQLGTVLPPPSEDWKINSQNHWMIISPKPLN